MKTILTFFKIELALWFRRKEHIFWSVFWPIMWLTFMRMIAPAVPNKTTLEALQFFLPSAVTLTLLSSAFTSLALAIARKKEDKLLRRFKIIPFSIIGYFWIEAVVALMFSLFSLLLLIIVYLLLGGKVDPVLWLLLAIVAAGFFPLASLAFFIAGIAKNISSANIYAMFIMFILMFLSSLFFDLSSAPSFIYGLSQILPTTILCDLLRDVLRYEAGLSASLWQITGLLVWGSGFLLLAKSTFRVE